MATLSPKMVTTLAGERNKIGILMYLITIDDPCSVLSDSLVKSALKLNSKKYRGVKYHTVAQNINGLIPPGSAGINHSKCAESSFWLIRARPLLLIGPRDRYFDGWCRCVAYCHNRKMSMGVPPYPTIVRKIRAWNAMTGETAAGQVCGICSS